MPKQMSDVNKKKIAARKAKNAKIARGEIYERPKAKPALIIDWAMFDQLAGIHCTLTEILSILGVSHNGLESACFRDKGMQIAEYLDIKRASGKMSLRRLQWKQAQNSVPMSIHLGKHWLEQTDKHEIVSENVNTNITHDAVDLSALADEELRQYLNLTQKLLTNKPQNKEPQNG